MNSRNTTAPTQPVDRDRRRLLQKQLLQLNKELLKGDVKKRVNIRDDLEGIIKKDPEQLHRKTDYIVPPDLAKKIFGTYYDKYERDRKKVEEKQTIIEEEDKTKKGDLYDLKLGEYMNTFKDVIGSQIKTTVAAVDNQISGVPENSTPVALFFSIVILCICIFFIIVKTSITLRITLGIISFLCTMAIVYILYYFKEQAIKSYYFSIPIFFMVMVIVGFVAALYYGYEYLSETAMFAQYSKIINILFAFIGSVLVLTLLATVKHLEYKRTAEKSHGDAIREGVFKAPWKAYFKYTAWLSGAFGIVAAALGLIQFISRESEFTGVFMTLLFAVFMVMTILYITYGFLSQIELPDTAFSRMISRIFSILYHFIFAIPCFLYEVVLNVKGTPTYVYKILAVQILIVLAYVFVPRIIKWGTTRNALQTTAVNLNHQKTYATFNDIFKLDDHDTRLNRTPWEKLKDYVMGESKTFMDYMKQTEHLDRKEFKYEYSVEFETFFHNLPPNTTHLGNQYVHVFNFAGLPSVWYKSNTQEFQFRNTHYVLKDDKLVREEKELYTMKIPVQRWNKSMINYKDGILDIFINGELKHTASGITPYIENDVIQSGQTDGIVGGIRNIYYTNHLQK
jgi:hypothetical protein